MSSSEQPGTATPPVQNHHTFHNPFSHSHKSEITTDISSKDEVYNPPYIRHPSHKPHSHASAPASEAAESGKYISEADWAQFAELVDKTRDMTPEETKAYLASLPQDNVGLKIMRGEPGYMQVTGAFSGTM